jgi:peptide/nickel transport system substrate-binding protein
MVANDRKKFSFSEASVGNNGFDMSRRALLRNSAIFGGSAFILAACGSSGSSNTNIKTTSAVSTTAGPGDKVPAGVKLGNNKSLTLAVSNMPASVDPMVEVGGDGRRFDIYECLVDQSPVTGVPRPFLATSWKQVDETTYDFTLRPGVKFHNGDPMTTDDVIFSLERGANPSYATAVNFSTFAKATAVNTSTVRVTTTGPDVLFLKKIAGISIMPKNYYMGLGSTDKARAAAFAQAPIGTGPYKFVSYTTSKSVVEIASTTWRHPTIEQITTLQVTDTGTQLNSFLAGSSQYVNLMPVSSIGELNKAGATLIELVKGNDLGAFIDSVEVGGAPKTGPMGNKQVRQALNYGINKAELVSSVLKNKTVADNGQLVAPGLPGYTTTVTSYPYDVAKAKQLLDAAGYPVKSGGSRFSLSMATAFAGPGSARLLIGEYLENQIAALDIDVSYSAETDITLEVDYFYDIKQRPDIYHFGLFSRPFMDAARTFNYFTSASKNYHMSNAQFDALFEQQQGEFDTAKRQTILAEMAEILHDEATFLFTTEDMWIDAAAKNLRGLVQADVQTEQYFDLLYFVAD